MPNVVRISRLQVTSVFGNRIRVSRITTGTTAVAAVGNRLRVSRLKFASVFEPTNVNRIRVSRLKASASTTGPGVFMWRAGQIVPLRGWAWVSGQIVPLTSASTVVLPPDPPVAADVYTDVYDDTY